MAPIRAVLVLAIASFWTFPGASCHNNLKMAVSNGTSTFTVNVNIRPAEFLKFYTCMCMNGPRKPSCSARLGNVDLIVNFDTWFYRPREVQSCTEVTKRADRVEVRINYALGDVQCNGNSAGRYIHIRGATGRCSSVCAAFVKHEAVPVPLQGGRGGVVIDGESCDTPCCENVLGVTTTATPPTTRAITTAAAAAITSGVSSYLNATPTAAGSNNHYHMHQSGSDVTVLVLSLVTASLAVTAIIISSVVFWRHTVRSKSKKEAAVALFRTGHTTSREDPRAEQSSNVYSDLTRNNAGSIHRYADLTSGNVECGRVTHDGASALGWRGGDSNGQATFPIYDDVTDNDTGYLQVTDD